MVAYQLPPYDLFRQAKNAAEALLDLEDERLMTSAIRLDADAPAMPVAQTLDPAAGTEPLLLTGGFYQDLEECPRFGCLARVIDRDGQTLFSWEVDPAQIAGAAPENFAGEFGPDNIYPIGLAYVTGGDLIVTFHARNSFPYQVGIARIGRDGSVKWVELDQTHHWLDAAADGTSYAPSARILPTPATVPGTSVEASCHNDSTFDEGVRVRDPDGQILEDHWIADSFVASDLPGLFYSRRDWCDPFHLNSVEVVSAEIAETLPGVSEGDYLVSVREPSLIAILSAEDGRVLLHSASRTAGQHSPHFLPDGTVLVFDNLGGPRAEEEGSRIVRLDLRNDTAETVYPREGVPGTLPLRSDDGGHLSVSPDGSRVMISSKHQSRSFEVDLETGKPLWSLSIGYDIADYFAMRDETSDVTRAWFNAYGVYYLDPGEVANLR